MREGEGEREEEREKKRDEKGRCYVIAFDRSGNLGFLLFCTLVHTIKGYVFKEEERGRMKVGERMSKKKRVQRLR